MRCVISTGKFERPVSRRSLGPFQCNPNLANDGDDGGNTFSLSINGVVDEIGSLYIVIDTDDEDEAFAPAFGGSPVSVAYVASTDADSDAASSADEIGGVRALLATGACGAGGSASGLLTIAGATLAFVVGGFGLRRSHER